MVIFDISFLIIIPLKAYLKMNRSALSITVFLLLPILLLGLSVAVLLLGQCARSYQAQLLNQGFRAEGVVVEKYNRYIDEYSPRIKYTFTTQDGKIMTSNSEYGTDLALYSNIEIAYDPATPSNNMPVMEGVNPNIWLDILIAAIVAAPAVFLLLIWIIRVKH
jgi:hypothetical protein